LKKINVRPKHQDLTHSAKHKKGERSFISEKKEKTKGQKSSDKSSAAEETAKTPKVGRNEPCPCGSGKKYKKCCLK